MLLFVCLFIVVCVCLYGVGTQKERADIRYEVLCEEDCAYEVILTS